MSSAGTGVAGDTPWQTLRRGVALSPTLREGLPLTVALGVAATGGRIMVPIVIQQTIDDGLGGGAVDTATVRNAVLLAAVVVVVTTICASLMYRRLAHSTETALSALRQRTFAHIHDQSALTQAAQQRGTLVTRVTDDIDQISQFMQWGGVALLINIGQVLLATIAMTVYSPPLTLVVVGFFLPYVFVLRRFQRRLSVRYDAVRTHVGDMLSSIAETVVAATVIRAYGIRARTQDRIDARVDAHYRARFRAIRTAAVMFSTGEIAAAVVTAAVVVTGILLGVSGRSELTAGSLVAYLFLVTLFVGPVQTVTEVLDQAQTAISGWRRVLAVLDQPSDVADPAEGVILPDGPLDVVVAAVGYTYPGASQPALSDVDLSLEAGTVTAIVGETGSGKSTLGRLLVRLTDPTSGSVSIGGQDLSTVAFRSLRRRVLLVPQDGFLFDATIGANVGFADRDEDPATGHRVRESFVSLGLGDWLDGLPAGLDTPAGERGTALSAGERQLVSLARAALADPDVLVLDEATSAVDPATEMRVNRALDHILNGRTAVVIAHRLSTAERADRVIVIDDGRVIEDGPHRVLLAQGGAYAALHAEWSRTTGADTIDPHGGMPVVTP